MIGFMSIFPGRPAQVGPAHNAQSPILPNSRLFAYLKLRARLSAHPISTVPSGSSPDYNAARNETEEAMRADRIEVSWDAATSKWLVRIVVGEEAIRRHCTNPKSADDQSLRSAALETARDEGYEADATQVTIRR
jgi:hypothetical protein